jgi:predicted PurR-regulated permease PerM
MEDDPNLPSGWDETKEDLLPYLRRLIVTIVVIALALLVWELKEVLLLAFAAVMVAVALLALTQFIRKITKLGHQLALAVACVIVVLILGVVIWLAWPAFQEQLNGLMTRLTDSIDQLQAVFGGALADNTQGIADTISNAVDQIWSTVITVAGGVLNVLTTLAVVLFSGVFLAADPGLYRRGLVMMFPRGWHEKITHGLNETGQALQLWLRAQLLTMTAVGTLVGLGTAAIGLPAPLALGLIAGITEFVPIVGPIIGAAPAVLVAVNDGPTLIWTVLLYVGVQQVEANLITPVLQRSIVSIPPVLLLLSFVALGGIFGSLGIVVAAPLTIAIFILVREFYIGDLLSERDQLSKLPLQKPARAKRRRTGRSAGKAPAEADDVTEP